MDYTPDGESVAKEVQEMQDVPRTDIDTARLKLEAGKALLVCAYAEPDKCDRIRIAGALRMDELRARLPQLPRDQELIFYCA